MIRLKHLDNNVLEIFDTEIRGMRAGERKNRIPALRGLVEEASKSYAENASNFSKALTSHAEYDDQNKFDMKWLYENRLVSSTSGRIVYDRILATSPTECPFCITGKPATLDHSLPKATFPFLAITPSNLVPACRDCNTEKGAATSVGNLSPYFDHWVEDESWLGAIVADFDFPENVSFFVKNVSAWSDEQRTSVVEFFNGIGLASKYERHAISEMSAWRSTFHDSYVLDGESLVLQEMTSRLRVHGDYRKNCWQVAAYQAWIDCISDVDW